MEPGAQGKTWSRIAILACGRNIGKDWSCMKSFINWDIGNGKMRNVWTDDWLLSGIIMDDERIFDLSIAELVPDNGDWNCDWLQSFLPQDTVEEILAIPHKIVAWISVSRKDLNKENFLLRMCIRC
ncbi:unnamed protein product [Vicia faba]|uniref:Uncharacterized protein n=1 Tax=Vicia faba TaxID=3906 RepID=A0AAV1AU64_VICFA|nr:unnamed protein product [Vicia faba]